jgi:NADH dehydrogenase
MLRNEPPHVVILGGGFAGLAAARALRRAPVRVTLVDRQNHHLFQPLLYQVATAALASPDIATPIRKLLRRQRDTTVLMAEVVGIDPTNKRVVLDRGELTYDFLFVATGMVTSYFGHDEWAAFAPGLKCIADALTIRSRILIAFETAERTPDPLRRRELTTFAIVGAGPTGVELAGAIAEIAGRTLARDFRHFDPQTTQVHLVEAGPRVLPTFAPELSDRAQRSLEGLGVRVHLNAPVTDVDARGLQAGATRIDAGTVIWAAGVAASSLTRDLGAPLDRAGRVRVTPELTVPGHPEIYVLGDLVSHEQDGKPLPGVSQLAMQTGRHAGEDVRRVLAGGRREPFHYRDKGSMATIGRARAIAEIGRVKLSGFVAWLLWLFIHIAFLIDFRNRLSVLVDWAWAYLTWQRSSRVIVAMPEHTVPMPAMAAVHAAP